MTSQTSRPLPGRWAVPGHWWAELPPAAGGCVMATGIISVGLGLTGYEVASLAALALGGLLWLLLAYDFAARLLRDRARWRSEADTPPALTAVAATTVLGTRFALLGWLSLAEALLALAAVACPYLLYAVVTRWRSRVPGAAFLVCVAPQGMGVLAGTLASAGVGVWAAWAGLACLCAGLLLYVAALVRFDRRELRTGRGDQWVAGGAPAISALCASKLAAYSPWHGASHGVLRGVTLILVALCLAWYAVLLASEVRWPRPHFDIRRWSTVFPLGMTAAACLSAAAPTDIPVLHTLGEVLLWVAVAAWLFTAARLAVTLRPAAPAGP
ncbi:tellurite resistance/C4-dicarboxylate transporter family protein [Streptomyces montanisoli]|uniref:tellurite resistance/C4-dicarboxylate transporter family protein n=1 Tax=Streptomyces montanisoli TaxID=2798581 RepID=UPI0027DBBBEF|nr:tellurite resistance/C4-dicarboxylate transporter family protein [Streptomyces montanisoli]